MVTRGGHGGKKLGFSWGSEAPPKYRCWWSRKLRSWPYLLGLYMGGLIFPASLEGQLFGDNSSWRQNSNWSLHFIYFFSFGNIVCWLFKTAKLCWLEIGQGMRSYGDVGLLIKSSIYSIYKNLLYFLFLIQIRLGLTYKSFFEISFFLVSKESL